MRTRTATGGSRLSRGARAIAIAIALAGAAAACGLSLTGAGPDPDADAQPPPAQPPPGEGGPYVDSGAEAEPPPACDAASDASCLALPLGWGLATLGAEDAPCPQRTANPTTLKENPTPATDACTCDTCAVTRQSSCYAGGVTVKWGTGGSCPNTDTPNGNIPDGDCLADMYTGNYSDSLSYSPTLSPSGATCASDLAVAHADRVTFSATFLACDGAERCVAGVCDAKFGDPSVRTCVARDGDASCPTGWPERHLLGSTPAFDCGACPACTVADACFAIMHLYRKESCDGRELSITADGVCRNSGANGSYKSYRLETKPSATCSQPAATLLAANARFTSPRTFCCR